jgi:hypothetical protein
VTLTEFLLARIADEERAAFTRIEQTPNDSSSGQLLRALTDQLLIELEAKRRVIEVHTGVHPCAVGHGWAGVRPEGAAGVYSADEPCPTLRALAASHDDHPEYRPEWRLDGS